jgi:2-oxoglutarate ferredoxin oxidoreductase subunit beta
MTATEIAADMELVYGYPESLTGASTIYCPGCTHGTIHRLIAEVVDELDIRERTLLVAPVGCSLMAYDYFALDGALAPHGRASAVAVGMKRSSPDKAVFSYQGDGDLAAIGTAEIIHVANRGELITTVFVNNAIYGMTGGQMAPTTLPGQVTTSSPTGRDVEAAGFPIRMAELLGGLPGAAYVTRQAVFGLRGIRRTKRAIKIAFQTQLQGLGFSLVEVLSICATNWKMSPEEALEWAEEHMVDYFPLGDTKVSDAVSAMIERQ